MVYPIVDVHAHLYDDKFAPDLDKVIGRAREQGLAAIINAGTDLATSSYLAQLAKKNDLLYATAGFHPHDAKSFKPGDLSLLRELLDQERVIAVGEMGLDYHYDFSPVETQKHVFIEQWRLAASLGMPTVVHLREAFEDFFKLISSEKSPAKVLLHCFSGDEDVAEKCIEMGFHFSIGGALTFSRAELTRNVFSMIPIERIHIETDCPYLAPHPLRGRRCEPAMVVHTFKKLCEVKKLEPAVVSEALLKNASGFFGISFVAGTLASP